METIKIEKNLLRKYLTIQFSLVGVFSLIIAIVTFTLLLYSEKVDFENFVYENLEDYLPLLEGNKDKEEIKIINSNNYSFYIYNSENKIVTKNVINNKLDELCFPVFKELKKEEIDFRFILCNSKFLPYFVFFTKGEIESDGKILGYTYVYYEISDFLKKFLYILIALFLLTITSFFIIYKSSLKMVKEAMKPILDSLETQKQFISDASHELKTPLSVMLASIECLKKEKENKLTDFSNEIIEDMSFEVKSMKNLLESLLLILREDSNKEKDKREIIDLVEIATNQFNRFKLLGQEKGISISFENHENLAAIYANKEELELLLTQIIDNAIKYTSNKGKILLNLKRENNFFFLSVSDNGMGISEEDLNKIFQRFYRADKSRSTKGAGLGLSIVKAYADKNNIEIKVESELGKGSKFTLIIPEFN